MYEIAEIFRGVKRAGRAGLCALAVLTASCGQVQVAGDTPAGGEGIAVTPYTMVETGRAWLYVPSGLVTLQRDLGNVHEQRVALPNDTTMEGDNFLLMRTRASRGLRGGRLDLDGFLKETGGLPHPFSGASAGQMQVAEDDLGPYFYLSRSAGPSITCVLAVRPITANARMLPRGADALDVMMRNCVRGDASVALEPMRSESLGRATARTAGDGQVALRNLSPFAAPQAVR